MQKLVRYEFLGSWTLFWVLIIFGITIPIGILYLIGETVRIEYQIEDVDGFLEEWKSGKRSWD